MDGIGANLISADSLFGIVDDTPSDTVERVVELPLSELHSFKDHPYRVVKDKAMQDMADSITERGVLVPLLVRPVEAGGYEIVSGHRRKMASELAGKENIPAIVRDMDDDTAIIIMVDSNIQREDLLPSEKAKAYRMKADALARKSGRPSNKNGVQVGHHSFDGKKTRDIIAAEAGESPTQVQRYMKLNDLVPELMEMVDSKDLKITPAVELAALPPEKQKECADLLKLEGRTPSLSQAQRLKTLNAEGQLDEDKMLSVLTEKKPQEDITVTVKFSRCSEYIPKDFTPQQLETLIIDLLKQWHTRQKKKNRGNER